MRLRYLGPRNLPCRSQLPSTNNSPMPKSVPKMVLLCRANQTGGRSHIDGAGFTRGSQYPRTHPRANGNHITAGGTPSRACPAHLRQPYLAIRLAVWTRHASRARRSVDLQRTGQVSSDRLEPNCRAPRVYGIRID
jgi:hypothetical protein